ncbi:putative membrane protein [Actinoplanes octamycinicus]|uniref:Putative membrane protein n=1 Tax=Actinoplanes octamycinicus TaxID=135948 RepID=A0A7W7H4U5_9ACTN|nr:alpha/beta hydrolase [Actinoplanes octamycinicus]MBB4743834.1 putative membrane protein [Actinoplanes octamycinicus]GIE58463.1 membrane protein [Actinoplanes octamycinicus]
MAVIPHPKPLDLTGSVAATALVCLSLTPSLLPRTWLVQGLVSGLCAVTGYAVGWVPGRLIRSRRPGWAWPAFAAVAVPVLSVAVYQGWRWQQEIGLLIGVPGPAAVSWPLLLPVAGLVFALLVGAVRLVRHAAAALRRRERRQRTAAAMMALCTLGPAGVAAPSGTLDSLSTTLDRRVTGVVAPVEATRSGSPVSLVPWATLGREGRSFVTSGSSTPHGTPVIRVYAGLRSAPTTRDRARLAVAELERTGAFDRAVLCLVIPTGTGWIDEPTVQALEDEYDGDTAVAVIQYGALPSWLSLLAEPQRSADAAHDLLDEVHWAWSRRPAGSRPRLLLYGHSQGALAAQSPFGTAGDLLGEVDGALISGPPNASPLWAGLVAGRSRTSTEMAPELPGQPGVRFADEAADLNPAADPAVRPRLVFLQHATDPVVWWSTDLILRRPDWLHESRPDAVLPSVRWIPFVTFWQVSGDLVKALDVPAGYGHGYGDEARAAWRLITGAPAAESEVLRAR